MPVKPLAPRHKTEDFGDKLVIWVPNRRVVPVIFVYSVWALFWLCFETMVILSAIRSVRSGDSNFFSVLLGLVLLSIIGVLLIYLWAWQLLGKEELEITNRSIKISRIVLGIKIPKEYLAEHIKNLDLARVSLSDLTPWGRSNSFFDYGVGMISFDYGARTYTFAGGVFDAEAKQIIAEIQQKFPQYKS